MLYTKICSLLFLWINYLVRLACWLADNEYLVQVSYIPFFLHYAQTIQVLAVRVKDRPAVLCKGGCI